MIWIKNIHGNQLFSKKAPLSYYEEIVVFGKNHCLNTEKLLRKYFNKVKKFIGVSLAEINKKLGHRKAEHCFYPSSALQFNICTNETYNELIQIFKINQMKGFKNYKELSSLQETSIFNLKKGNAFKSNVLTYPKDLPSYHSTQKPIALMEDLIFTYTNEGDTVLDFTAGSGSTGIAARNLGRKFIMIEKEEKYCKVIKDRLEAHYQRKFI